MSRLLGPRPWFAPAALFAYGTLRCPNHPAGAPGSSAGQRVYGRTGLAIQPPLVKFRDAVEILYEDSYTEAIASGDPFGDPDRRTRHGRLGWLCPDF